MTESYGPYQLQYRLTDGDEWITESYARKERRDLMFEQAKRCGLQARRLSRPKRRRRVKASASGPERKRGGVSGAAVGTPPSTKGRETLTEALPQTDALRLAYADPPYPGQASKWYRDHPDFDGEVKLDVLISTLQDYDGWALSTSMTALRQALLLCPMRAVVAVWHVTNAMPPGGASWLHHYAWEPVIVVPARPNKSVKNVISAASPMGFLSTREGEETFPGKKPPAFSRWLFELLGARAHDDFTDLFPGSGAVGREWQAWSSQTRLAV